MGNPWHLVVRPRADEALERLMRWVGLTHVRRPSRWRPTVNEPMEADRIEALRISMNRRRPFDDAACIQTAAARLGLGFTLRGPGCPKKRVNQ